MGGWTDRRMVNGGRAKMRTGLQKKSRRRWWCVDVWGQPL